LHVRTGIGLPRPSSALGLDGAGLTPATPAPILGGFQKLIAAPSLAVMLICPIEYRRVCTREASPPNEPGRPVRADA
jgi:hypothetical protein